MPPTASSSLLSHPSPSPPPPFIVFFLLPPSSIPLVIYSIPPFFPLPSPLSPGGSLFIPSFPSLLPPSSSPFPVVLSPFNPSGERPSSRLLHTIIPLLSSSPPLPSSSCSFSSLSTAIIYLLPPFLLPFYLPTSLPLPLFQPRNVVNHFPPSLPLPPCRCFLFSARLSLSLSLCLSCPSSSSFFSSSSVSSTSQ